MAAQWNHTVQYHDILLKNVPKPCSRALDIGCGEGAFARRLARLSDEVLAIDASEDVIIRARALSADFPNVRFVTADFSTFPLENATYDFISLLATLHHLPFREAIEQVKLALRPGGILGVVGLFKEHSPLDYMSSAIAWPVSRALRLIRGREILRVPIKPPQLTLQNIREESAQLLPGSVIKRHLLWRYTLVWKKP